jgi:DNA polymerase-3 subunit delta'
MAWSDVVGHEAVAEQFRESLTRGRLSHAYLLVGPEGIGKERFARELAKTVLCAQEADEACGACPACRKVEHGNHPDVTVVRRMEGSGKSKRRSRILIDQVREEIQDVIAYKPFEGRRKVFIVSDADRMTEEAQNCLLKTLEEPPPSSLLLLVAARLEPFVDTVVSRCQVVRFRPLEPGQVEAILTEHLEVEPGPAAALARLSGGSPGRAVRFLESGAYATGTWLFEQLAERGSATEFELAGELLDRSKEAGDSLEETRDQLRAVLELVTLAWRDGLLGRLGCPPEQLSWGEACPEVSAVLDGLSADDARGLVQASLAARERLDRNANIKLVLEKFVLDISAVLRDRELIDAR